MTIAQAREKCIAGMKYGMEINADTAVIQRGLETHTIRCRVSHQSEGVWDKTTGDTGATIDKTPYAFTVNLDADVITGDLMQWRNAWYQVGTVTIAENIGGPCVKQWQLKEVDYGG